MVEDRGGALQPKDDVSRRLGEQFRRIRKSRGIGVRTLAKQIGRSFYLIRRHEAGTMMLRTDDLYRSAQALKVRPAELLYVEETAQ